MTPNLPKRGAVSTLALEYVRDITPDDLVRLASAPKKGPPPIQKFKASHHRQAQLVARGIYTDATVARLCGVTPQRIYQLKTGDPLFKELVAYYQTQIDETNAEASERVQGKLLVAGEAALDEINERLEDETARAEIPVGELRKIVEMVADRTVAPPKATSANVAPPATITLNFGTELKPKPAPVVIDADETSS